MPDETNNTTGAATPVTPASGTQSGSGAANEHQGEQQQTSGWKAAEQFKSEALQLRKELEAVKTAQQKAEEAKLAEQGKWEEIAKAKEAEAKTSRDLFASERRKNALLAAASRVGFEDPSDAIDLLLRKMEDVDVNDLEAVNKAAMELADTAAKAKPYLLKQTNGKPNNVTTSGLPAGGQKPVSLDTLSPKQISDFANNDPEGFKKAMAAKYPSGTGRVI